jgi:hypothetical protein
LIFIARLAVLALKRDAEMAVAFTYGGGRSQRQQPQQLTGKVLPAAKDKTPVHGMPGTKRFTLVSTIENQ